MIEKKRPRRRRPRLNQKRSSSPMRAYDNRGLNVPRSRGAISKALEKYTNLAQDAFSNGDRIVAEGYYQYAEHYQRVLNETAEEPKSSDSVRSPGTPNIKDEPAVKPSRTQRAYDAKNERIGTSHNPSKDLKTDNKDLKTDKLADKSYTSDGLEALKPFEV